MKKYRSERKGRRSFDTAIQYGTVAMVARKRLPVAAVFVNALSVDSVPMIARTCTTGDSQHCI